VDICIAQKVQKVASLSEGSTCASFHSFCSPHAANEQSAQQPAQQQQQQQQGQH